MINGYRKCVFCVVYADREFLLLHRKLNWEGWEFCKGGIRKNETPEQAVKREIREETHLKLLEIKKFNIKGKFLYDKKSQKQKGYKGASYILFSAKVKKGKVKYSKTEHDGYKWCSFKQALKLLEFENQRKCLKIVEKSIK